MAAAKQVTTGTPTVPSTLALTRAQGSGPLTVKLVVSNGGASVAATLTLAVTEPATDPWLQRTPGVNEIPVTGQFYARDDSGMGKIYYNGLQAGAPDQVFLKVYTTDTGADVLYSTQRQVLVSQRYTFTAPVNAGLVTYKVTYGTTTGGIDSPLNSVTNLVCGDAYIFEGQSNSLATQDLPADATNNTWIRTYGNNGGGWGNAVRSDTQWTVGYFAFDLALSLTNTYNMPICIINGAVGGTRIDQHQPNPVDRTLPGESYSIYSNLLNRVIGAKLTHGIRGIVWHQGEANNDAESPTGDYDYKSYQQYFIDMSAAWKQDYPNFQRYTVFQVMPKPCALGPKGDQQREAQRTLPFSYAKMDILNTLGLSGYLGCHFTAAGYENVADRTLALFKQRYYNVVPPQPVTTANLKRAYFTTSTRNEIALEFDQDMSWNNFSKVNYYIDEVANRVLSGGASGKIVKLQLSAPATATSTLDYLKDDYWNEGESVSSLLYGANTLPALTFADVAIEPAVSAYAAWASDSGLGQNAGALADPDGDGITNLLEFILGGGPLTSSQAVLPKVVTVSGGLVFEYDRSDASMTPATVQIVEYGSDLTGWTSVPILDASAGIVTITQGSPTDRVKVTIPASGSRQFARLKVSQP